MTKPGRRHNVARTHQTTHYANALITPHQRPPVNALSRCDNTVTHAVRNSAVTPIVTRDPRPVPVPVLTSPNAVNPPTSVVTCNYSPWNRSLANATRELEASERRKICTETAQP